MRRAREEQILNFGKGFKRSSRNLNGGYKPTMKVCQKNTLFWEDIWLVDVPLRLKFPTVYRCCRDTNAIVRDCWGLGSWGFDFRRTFGPEEVKEWYELLSLLHNFSLSDSPDRAV